MNDFNILIVDDNADNIVVLKELLSNIANVDLLVATNGEETLNTVLRNKVDLLLLDIQLPDIDGYQIAKLIKSKKATMNIPIVFVTAIYRSESNVIKGYEMGAIDYLFKPISEKVLLTKVDFYIKQKQARDELLSEIEVQKTYLEKRNTQLEKLRVELLESRNNWKYLGENIPSQVFIFNNDFEIEFSNTINFEIPGYLDLEFLRGFAVETFSKKKNIKKKINYKKDLWLELYCVFEDEEDHSKVMIIISDISENVEYQNKIEYLGFNDLLTGLRNRHYFMINKSELLQSDNYPISVIVGDVEGLKLINDVFGHEYGDQLLKRSAEIFNSIDNSGKSCIRWGGDEFVLLIPNTGDEASIKIIDQLDNEFRSIDIDGIIQFGVSLGYSIIKSSDKPFFEAFKQAEDRMYLNKLSHRNREKSNILDTLHTTLLQKNYETAEHTQRMSELGIEFGHYLGLKNHEIDILATLLTIHDIGKISIDKAILEKPTKLNEVEWEQIRKHSEIGFRLCSTIPELLANADAILSHHERWDGFGYPQGLKGEEIPFMARMICVIDSFDVMTHKRVYKKAMTVGNALVEIEKCSGTQFDPLLAANFIEFMSNK